MADLTDAQRAFVRDNPFVAVMTTLRADGSPHSTVVWIDADEQGVYVNTPRGSAKVRHLEADPRLTVVVVDPADMYRWVSVTGTATLVDEGANAQIDHLAQKFLGVDVYPWHTPDEQRVTVRVQADKIGGIGLDA